MAYFAKLNSNNIVTQVISVNDKELIDENGNESEQKGIEFINKLYNTNDVWKQTSYNTSQGNHLNGKTPLRKNFAGIGYIYDQVRDAFIAQKPHNSWVLDENKCTYKAPVPLPTKPWPDNIIYLWDEETVSWKEFNLSEQN
jgi:hypothetical protein